MNVEKKDDLILPFTDPEFVFFVILLYFLFWLISFQQEKKIMVKYESIMIKNYVCQSKLY